MNKELFKKTNRETKILIKEEAEKAIKSLHDVDNVINTKANNLLKISLSILIISASYFLTSNKHDSIYLCSILSAITMSLTSIFIHFLLRPKTMAISGSNPKSFMKEKYLKLDESDYDRVLENRCFSLSTGIDSTLSTVSDKSKMYSKIEKLSILGLTTCVAISVLYFIFQSYLCKC